MAEKKYSAREWTMLFFVILSVLCALIAMISGMDFIDGLGFIFGGLIIAVWYFTPYIIALCREHKKMLRIFWLNLLTGWTRVGWLVALIWALNHDILASSKKVKKH